MNWKISVLILSFLSISCQQKKENSIADYEGYLISAQEFLAVDTSENLKILDFRKKEVYAKGHVPNAIQIWRNDIQNPNYNYGGMMPSPEQLESLFSRFGITNEDTLVIYDDNGLCEAARLWWILQNYDFTRVKLLQGGISAYTNAGGQLNTANPKVTKSNFKFSKNPSMKFYASKEDMLMGIKSKTKILDTRSTDEYLGINQKKGAAKAGRIPGSIQIDWAEAINYHTDKSLKSVEELEKIYNRLGVEKNHPILVYCHSGVRSAHTTFVLTQILMYKNVKNYDGSWTEWSHHDELPIENKSLTLN